MADMRRDAVLAPALDKSPGSPVSSDDAELLEIESVGEPPLDDGASVVDVGSEIVVVGDVVEVLAGTTVDPGATVVVLEPGIVVVVDVVVDVVDVVVVGALGVTV